MLHSFSLLYTWPVTALSVRECQVVSWGKLKKLWVKCYLMIQQALRSTDLFSMDFNNWVLHDWRLAYCILQLESCMLAW